MKPLALPLFSAAVLSLFLLEAEAAEQTSWKLDFGGETALGAVSVPPGAVFTPEAGFGFEPGATVQATARGGADKLRDGFVSSDKPFLFSVAVPEGMYRVTVALGDAQGPSTTTVKAEARRLMLQKVETAARKFETRSFLVAVKRPEIKGGGTVSLKPVELDGHPDWDTKLTLEFSDARPALCALEIVPAQNFTTLYIAGDSTVTNQNTEPFAGWGQMLPRFFNETVVVSNHAHSGLALKSFAGGKRLEKILGTIKKGDYLFIQFGHNDQKDKSPNAGPFTTYKENLKNYVEAVREKGGIPVLVTPMERRRFEKDGTVLATLSDYAEAVRQVGAEDKVPVIDLHAMSLKLYAALGDEKSKKAFAFYPANTFPGRTEALKDNTHHNVYGGYELARCIVEGIKANVPELAKHLAKDAGAFDPAKPDDPEKLGIPVSPIKGAAEKPEGS